MKTLAIIALIVGFASVPMAGAKENQLFPSQVVIYDLQIDPYGPGTWQVLASASLGDNYGIAGFGIAMTGAATIVNESPMATLFDGTDLYDVGFQLMRTAMDVNPVTGCIDPTTQGVPVAYGVGQTAGDLLADLGGTGWMYTGIRVNPTYGAPVLLAAGTYSGDAPEIDFQSWDTAAIVFLSDTGTAVGYAAVVPPKPIEPMTLSLVLLGGLGVLRRRR